MAGPDRRGELPAFRTVLENSYAAIVGGARLWRSLLRLVNHHYRVMRYIAVHWHHHCADEPIEMISEIDDDGWEQRKVEIYADGRRDYADESEQTGSTQLGLVPIPSLAEIASDPEFSAREISRDEFETVWKSARVSKG